MVHGREIQTVWGQLLDFDYDFWKWYLISDQVHGILSSKIKKAVPIAGLYACKVQSMDTPMEERNCTSGIF